MDEDKLCRLCGSTTKLEFCSKNIFGDQFLIGIVFSLTSIKLVYDSELPDSACENCIAKLLEFSNFRNICINANNDFINQKKIKSEILFECNELQDSLSFDLKEEHETLNVEVNLEEGDDDKFNNSDSDSSNGDRLNDLEVERDEERKKKERKDNRKIYPCTKCKRKFYKEFRFIGHMRQHEGLKPAVCNICGKEFSKFSGLYTHVQQSHSGEKRSFVCDFPECGRVYSMKQSLTSHMRKHKEGGSTTEIPKQYVCEQCGKTLTSRSALTKHNTIHTGILPYICAVCPKKFSTKHKLKEHTMRHQGIKQHVCPHCGMKKTTLHELKTHINYHTRDKLYTCHICAVVFTNSGNLSRHVKIVHCGVKSYPCTYCDRSFGKAETLKHHAMTHTGEKPHGCNICGKKFIQAIALKTHMKTHKKYNVMPEIMPMPNQ